MKPIMMKIRLVILTISLFAVLGTSDLLAIDITGCGYLNQANATYVLQNDVSSEGSCFFITNANITLDLNGHKVTYDNAMPVTVTNGDFETTGGWDLSAGPNAAIMPGSYVKPVSVYSGSQSLRIAVPATDQSVRGTSPIQLQPNTYYTLSAMIYNMVNDPVTMYVELEGTGTRVSRTGKTWRGFGYIYKEFKTGETPSPVAIVAGISGGTTGGSGYVYFDDIRIQRTRVAGVVLGPESYLGQLKISDAFQFGAANYATVSNGIIQQGQSKSDFSPCFYIFEASGTGWKFHDLTLISDGANSRSVKSYNGKDVQFYNNHIYNPQRAITSRDAFDGAAVYVEYTGYGTKVFNNTVHQGVQAAFYIRQKTGYSQNEVYGNTIELQTRHTNDFAILANGSKIYGNTINCGNGDNSCRGIAIGGNDTIVYKNIINVQELPRNQEYNGCEMGGAYGMQMEYDTRRLDVYNNTVTAYAGDCEAYAFRANPYSSGTTNSTNNAVHDNTFVAIKNGTARAATIKYSELIGTNVNVYNNTFRTNHRWIYVDGGGPVTNPTFDGNRWETTGTPTSPFYPFEVYTWANSHFNGSFYRNTYGPGDKERFESEVFRLANGTPDPLSSIVVSEASSTISPPAGLTIKQ